MNRGKPEFLVPPPRDKRGGSGVAGVAAMRCDRGYFAVGQRIS